MSRSAAKETRRNGTIRCAIYTWSRENVILISAPRVAAQLVVIEGDTEAGPGGHVDPEVREAERLLDKIVDEDLRAEMLAAPGEIAQSGEMRGYSCKLPCK